MDLAGRFIMSGESFSITIISLILLLAGGVRLCWGWGHCNLSISDLETDQVQHDDSQSVESDATIFLALSEFPQFIAELSFLLIGCSVIRDEAHFSKNLHHLLKVKVLIRHQSICSLLLFYLIRPTQMLPQYDLLLHQAEIPLESLPHKLLALLVVVRFGLWEIADLVKLLLGSLMLFPSLIGIVIEDLLQVVSFFGTATTL